jgi:hypothetical protein
MKSALIALAALVPALAFADDPAPYVVHEGRAVTRSQSAPSAPSAQRPSSFGTGAIRTQISGGRSGAASTSSSSEAAFRGTPSRAVSGARAFRSTRHSGRRGITGTPPATSPAPAADAPPPYAVPGAKILSAGHQPVYSDPGNGGMHSVEGGGFIAIDQARARDVGRTPGISWAPPDTPPGANPKSGGSGGGSGASANGPTPGSGGDGHSGGPTIIVNNGNTNGGTDQRDNSPTGFNPAF